MEIETIFTKINLYTHLTNLTLRPTYKHKLFDRNLAYRKQPLRQCNRRRAPVPPPIFFTARLYPRHSFTHPFTPVFSPASQSRRAGHAVFPTEIADPSVYQPPMFDWPSSPLIHRRRRDPIPIPSNFPSAAAAPPLHHLPPRPQATTPPPSPSMAAGGLESRGGRQAEASPEREGGTPCCAACWTRSGGPADRGDPDGGGLRRRGSPCQGRLGCQ